LCFSASWANASQVSGPSGLIEYVRTAGSVMAGG
jgi:hypothetical protein